MRQLVALSAIGRRDDERARQSADLELAGDSLLSDWQALNESRSKAARQTWAVRNIGATITPDIDWTPSAQGPTCIPYRDMFGGSGGTPNHLAL